MYVVFYYCNGCVRLLISVQFLGGIFLWSGCCVTQTSGKLPVPRGIEAEQRGETASQHRCDITYTCPTQEDNFTFIYVSNTVASLAQTLEAGGTDTTMLIWLTDYLILSSCLIAGWATPPSPPAAATLTTPHCHTTLAQTLEAGGTDTYLKSGLISAFNVFYCLATYMNIFTDLQRSGNSLNIYSQTAF